MNEFTNGMVQKQWAALVQSMYLSNFFLFGGGGRRTKSLTVHCTQAIRKLLVETTWEGKEIMVQCQDVIGQKGEISEVGKTLGE